MENQIKRNKISVLQKPFILLILFIACFFVFIYFYIKFTDKIEFEKYCKNPYNNAYHKVYECIISNDISKYKLKKIEKECERKGLNYSFIKMREGYECREPYSSFPYDI